MRQQRSPLGAAFLKEFSSAVHNRRKKLKLTQNQLGKEAKISRCFLAAIEIGTEFPSIDTILSLSTHLDIDMGDVQRRAAIRVEKDASEDVAARREHGGECDVV